MVYAQLYTPTLYARGDQNDTMCLPLLLPNFGRWCQSLNLELQVSARLVATPQYLPVCTHSQQWAYRHTAKPGFSMGAGNLNSGPPSCLRIKHFTHRTVSWPISIMSVQNGPHGARAILELLMLLPLFPSAEITDVCHHNQLFRWIFNNIKIYDTYLSFK